MNRTSIEWCRSLDGSPGFSWNVITGCLGPKGDGAHCSYCYAYKLANRRLAEIYLANENIAFERDMSMCNKANPFYPRFWPERLHQPLFVKKPLGIFTVNMGELFGDWIPREWQDKIFNVIRACPQHRFYLLTKQPQNLPVWSPFPQNVYLGVTATNQEQFDEAIKYLKMVDAKVKFLSFEPLLDHIIKMPGKLEKAGISWVIIGGQTNPRIQPQRKWVTDIIRAADEAKIPVFLKDNLCRDLAIFNNLRQEMPSALSQFNKPRVAEH